jgi:hypothetical protein
MTADIVLKRGQTADVTFALIDVDSAPFDLTGYVVTLAIAGRATRLERVATLDSPASLGTGRFSFTSVDYDVLRVGVDIPFEMWAISGATRTPFRTGVLHVVDVPQVTS